MRQILTSLALLALVSMLPVKGEAKEGIEQLRALSDAFTSVVAEVKPSVVAIVTEREIVQSEDPYRGTPFEHFFSPFRGERQPRQGQGSGVVVSYGSDYYILTNNHVIAEAKEIQVQLAEDRHFDAEVVGADSLSDLAVLKVEEDDLPAVPLGNSDKLRVGEWVLALGNPFGLEHTVTSGIISALGRDRIGSEYGSFIQTDASINPGNSGGPLVNLSGEIVGINTAIIGAGSRYGGNVGSAGVGFAIPANLARNVLRQLVEYGEVRRGLLGIGIGDVDPVMAEALGMENTQGVLVRRVAQESAAYKAGVKVGDVILAVDGESMRNSTDLRSRIGATEPGTRVELEVLRDDKSRHIEVVLDQLTEETRSAAGPATHTEKRLGFHVQDLTLEIAQRLGYEEGSGVLVVGVESGSEAQKQGLRRGDLIAEVERKPVSSVEEYAEAIDQIGEDDKAILMLVRRGKRTVFVAMRVR